MAKVTKRDNFVAIKAVLTDVDQIAFVDAQIALLDKRKGAERKLTKAQVENEGIKDVIVEVLADVENGATATDLANAVGITVQKTSQLLRQLVAENRVDRVDAKGKDKARFTAVSE